MAIAIRQLIRSASLALASLTALATVPANAQVQSVDLSAPGDGLLTRDTVNNREWLDLTQTRGLSINAARAATRPGGAYAGFRIARLNELVDFYAQAVGPVAVESNGNTPIFDFTDDERVAQRNFVNLIGVTFSMDFSTSFDPIGIRNDAIGLLRTSAGTGDPRLVAGGLFFYFENPGNPSYSWFNDGFTSSRDYGDSNTGVFLVRNIGGVPEPTTWAMMIGGFGLIGGAMRRQQQRPKLAALPA